MADETSWVLKAVEAEAFNRAADFVLKNPKLHIRIFGLTHDQIRALMDYYEDHAGKPAHLILKEKVNG
jgi:hypothetical protein